MEQTETTIRHFELQEVDVDSVELDPTNPNVMSAEQMKAMRQSMQKYGYLAPIIIDKNNKICDGEHRLLIYKEMGLTSIPAYKLDLDSEYDRRQLRQIMNKLHGQHDRARDADEFLTIMQQSQDNTLQELSQLIAQPQEHLLELIRHYHPEVEIYKTEPREEYSLPEVPETQLAQIWQLGSHRLVCGDCTDKRLLDSLMLPDDKISQLNCDPPYGVDYSSKNEFFRSTDHAENTIKAPYSNDEVDTDYHAMFCEIFKNIKPYWAEQNTFYIWSLGQHLHNIRMAINDSSLVWSDYLIWLKNNHVLGRKDYNAQHEFCIYGWYGKHKFYGPFRTTILQYDKPLVNRLHPTMKPIELIRQTVTDGTKAGDLVLDMFAGAGSSLIACEQTGRTWRGIELDPHYCDIIVQRWQDYTGQKAEKVPTA